MDRNKEKTDINGNKQKETDRKRQKLTETDRNRQKPTKTDLALLQFAFYLQLRPFNSTKKNIYNGYRKNKDFKIVQSSRDFRSFR